MSPKSSVSAVFIAFGLGALSCGDPRAVSTGRLTTCTECHGGGANLTGAPPHDVHGRSDPSLPSVGAHTAHVQSGALSGGFDCDACHVKPAAVDSPGHIGGPVTIEWSALATANGALAPQYDRSSYGCSSVYCHGSFPGGNAGNVPVWTKGADQATCGTCHGRPDATPASLPVGHSRLASGSTNATCNACHAGTIEADGTMDVAGGKHVNGEVEFDPAAVHPDGWLDTTSASFHGLAAAPSHQDCLRCHAVSLPAQVTTVVCNGCHRLLGTPITP